jgi:acetylornithine deacetylase
MASEAVEKVLSEFDPEIVLGITQDMVRIPSVLGDEKRIGEYLKSKMDELGFEETELQEVFPDRYNAIGCFHGKRPGPTFVLTGHMDTKPVSEGWDSDPFSGKRENGRIYGHGIGDMKAGLASQIAAAYAVAKSVDFAGTLWVAGVCDHRGEQQGSIDFFKKVKADLCILGETSNLRIYLGHRGRYYFDISAIGKSAHTCHRYDAINPIPMMAKLVLKLDQIRYFPKLDKLTADLFGEELYTVVGRIYGGLPPDGPSMIPDRCTIRVDCRPQPGISSDEVRAVLEKAIEEAKAEDPTLKTEVVLADVKQPHWIDAESPLVKMIQESVQRVKGEEPKLYGASWLGDTASFGRDVPTVIFGPGRPPVYMANEYLEEKEIVTAAKVYAATVAKALT